MGLSRLSVETPIEVEVILPTQDIWDITKKNSPALIGLGVILVLGLALLGLISRGRIRPGKNRLFSFVKTNSIQAVKLFKQIITRKKQPLAVPERSNINTYRLIPVNDLTQQLFPEYIQVTQTEITLGNSNRKDGIRIQHPSIISEHARITASEGNQYQITDLGSTAGTWINYQQIPPGSPHLIKDGDIINIGEAAFRFQFKEGLTSLVGTKEN
jgi:hypothetical protein